MGRRIHVNFRIVVIDEQKRGKGVRLEEYKGDSNESLWHFFFKARKACNQQYHF